ncbi:MAG: hypothetical protein BWY50_01917 [Spirochaetes bacterium ADurb.Bin315]|nr:MAG: hypothetical protein BWY50_01917 [Spirochaetes bacterium ADurb.Bin315]
MVLIFGVNLSFVGPTLSAPTSIVPVTPKAGRRATKSTTIPIPPSQLVWERQKRIDRGRLSISLNVVAPVVVNPLMVSKNAEE